LASDFHKSLTEKIAALRPSTPATRRAVYEAAREKLLAGVRAAAPSIPVAEVIARQQALEEIILAIETEARRNDPPAPPPPPVPKRKPPTEPKPASQSEPLSSLEAKPEPQPSVETKAEPESSHETQPAAADSSSDREEETRSVQSVANEESKLAQSPALELLVAKFSASAAPPSARDVAVAPTLPEELEESREEIQQAEDRFKPAESTEEVEYEEGSEGVLSAVERTGAPWRIAVYVAAAATIGATIVFAAAFAWRAFETKPVAKVTVQATTKPVEAPPEASALITGAGFAAAAQAAFKQGVDLLAQGDAERAILALDDAIRLDPTQPAAYGNRAFAHWRKGSAELAARDYAEAIRLDPKNLPYRLNRAIANNRLGNYDAAITDLDEVIRAEPENPAALNSRCWARALIGGLEEALVDCNQAVRLAPKDANVLDSRGFVHLKAGRLVRAVADYSSALRIDPKLASSLYGRGIARIGRGDRGGGTEDVAAAKAINPDIQAEFARYGIR
jgi:tetratricopeptide (TPR) repeat protein